MSEISLRAYINKLDSLLSSGAADEVIHHCRHILRFYPKNVAAYRALGRALLLNGRWEEAGAAFRRVLSVIPDDYYANLGLSEVYDHLRKADEAIWHAERAYEQEPNRQDVLDAIRSLYRKYRNIDNARVQLTSSALARQSIRNRQYEQALETLRTALNRMQDRLDLKILLARTLWELGDHVQAAETALEVHEKLPDCLDTNRILTRLWLDVQRPSDAQKYLNRIEAVEPYLALELVTGNAVEDNAFKIEELDYRISAQSELATARPDWLRDLGSDLAPDPRTEQWLNRAQRQGTHVLTPQTGGLLGYNRESDENDWMKALDKPLEGSVSKASAADADELPEEFAFTSDTADSGANSSSSFDFDFDEVPNLETAAGGDTLVGFDQDPMAWLREAGIDADSAPDTPRSVQAGSEDLGELFADLGETRAGEPDDPMAWLNEYSGEYRPDEAPATASNEMIDDDSFDLFFDLPAESPASQASPLNDDAAWLTDLEQRAQASAASGRAQMPDDEQFLDETLGLEALTGLADSRSALPEPEFDLGDFAPKSDAPTLFDEPNFEDLPPADAESLDLFGELNFKRERYKTGTFQTLNLDDSPDPLDQIVSPGDEFAPVIDDRSPGVSQDDLNDLFGDLDAGQTPPVETDVPQIPSAEELDGQIAVGWEDPGIMPPVSGEVPGPRRGLTAMLKDADLDWLNAPADDAPSAADLPQETPALSSDLGEWLSQFDAPQTSSAGEVSGADAELDWLAELNANSTSAETDGLMPGDDALSQAPEQPFEWFPTGEAAQEVSAMDENQSGLQADQPEEEDSGLTAAADDLAVPDWLRDLEGVQSEAAEAGVDLSPASASGDPEQTLAVSQEIPDWLAAAAPLQSTAYNEPSIDDPGLLTNASDSDFDSLFGVTMQRAESDPETASGGGHLDEVFEMAMPGDLNADFGESPVQDSGTADDLDWLDQLEPSDAREQGDEPERLEAAEPVSNVDSLDWLNELQPVEMEAEQPVDLEESPVIDFETLFADTPQAHSEEAEPIEEPAGEAPAVTQFITDLETDDSLLEGAVSDAEGAGTLIFPPGDVAAAAGLAAAAANETPAAEEPSLDAAVELGELTAQEPALFDLGAAQTAAEFEAAVTVESDLLDFEPSLNLSTSQSAPIDDSEAADEVLELTVTPAENAPDWLNAMVPGLDVDYNATEDETIETSFIDANDTAIGFDDSQPQPEEQPAAVYTDIGAAPGYDWLVDIVEEESQQLVPITPAASASPAPRRRFVFTRRPPWYKSDADAGTEQANVPAWLR